jgi:hypothetical protein
MSRSLYLVLPDWEGDPDDVHESVVEDLLHGPRYMQVGIELWTVAGRAERAKEIEDLLEVAYSRPLLVLNTEEIRRLDALLDGLEDALKPFLDDGWRILPEHMDTFRSRTTLLHLEDVGGQIGAYGVFEGISEVRALRSFLREAIERGLHLRMG